MMPPLYLATANQHKVKELAALLAAHFDVRPVAELDPAFSPVEDASTFAGNARIKAEAARRLTKHAVLADDSGLAVDALNGAPGVRSARYGADGGEGSGDDANNARLLRELAAVPAEKRGARFVCALHFIAADGTHAAFQGECPGAILSTARGGGGFGYDPLFIVRAPEVHAPGSPDRTMAELTLAEKNSVSHRARAMAALLAHLASH